MSMIHISPHTLMRAHAEYKLRHGDRAARSLVLRIGGTPRIVNVPVEKRAELLAELERESDAAR
jgi:hypothetical protein